MNIEVLSLPRIGFAHEHSAEKYCSHFSPARESIEISYIYEGVLYVDDGIKKWRAEKGDILCLIHNFDTYITADVFHTHHTVGAAVNWEHRGIGDGLFLPTVTKSSAATGEIEKIIDALIYKPYNYEGSLAKASSEFLRLLCLIDEANKVQKKSDYNILTERAKKYIYKNIRSSISLAATAEYLGVTPQYLCNVFKKSEGISLIRYVNTVKLKNIKSLMEKENIKLYEAARLYGYSDANYVSNLYKKIFGINITSKTTDSGTKEVSSL
ncbi:MAG: helix-turn-helix transcriptional regulator [Ruminococcaceae bacterium]|nr:helix-turn-helix transcriptional regulator [Oscillospiraceae bacterium]